MGKAGHYFQIPKLGNKGPATNQMASPYQTGRVHPGQARTTPARSKMSMMAKVRNSSEKMSVLLESISEDF